tara:strand:+ start:498 stop:671 length:174 start_codon:yes stop_codon:yes gene_type:complete
MLTINEIIAGYCEGICHLEFEADKLPDMVAEIKKAVISQLDDAEHLDDARSYVQNYL